MRVLLDTCVWGGAAKTPRNAGHDVRCIGETAPDPGDEAILQLAFDEDRVLVTLDKDFGELAVVHRRAHGGMVRLVGLPARKQGAYCAEPLDRYRDERLHGAILTATSERVRVRSGHMPAQRSGLERDDAPASLRILRRSSVASLPRLLVTKLGSAT